MEVLVEHIAEHDELVTVEEAADLLKIGRTKTFELLRSGRLGSALIGRRRVVSRRAIDRFIEALTQAGIDA
jgi:excisionase family DNA binding protein